MLRGVGWAGIAANLLIVVFAVGLAGCAEMGSSGNRIAPRSLQIAEAGTQIPFELVHGCILFKGRTPSGEHWVMLDTGAMGSIMSPALVAREQAKQVRTSPFVGANGQRIETPVVVLPSLVVGSATLRGLPAASHSLQDQTEFCGREVDIVLGISAFEDALLTVDYQKRVLTLEEGRLPEADGKTVLRMNRMAYGRLLMPVNVAGRELWVAPDTGATHGIVCPDWAEELFPESRSASYAGRVKYWDGEGASRVVRVKGDMNVGQTMVPAPAVVLAGRTEPLIGYDLLKSFRMTIDQRRELIRMTPVNASQIRVQGPRVPGISIAKSGCVTYVVPGGEAEKAGIRPGDWLVAVNDKSFSPFVPKQALWESTDDVVVLTIQRGQERLRITVPMTPVVR